MRVREIAVEVSIKTIMVPAGILKCGPRWRSIVRACRTVKLIRTPIGVLKKMPLDSIGNILIKDLRSSTCCTEQSLHGLAMELSELVSPSAFSAAQFRNLHCVMASGLLGSS